MDFRNVSKKVGFQRFANPPDLCEILAIPSTLQLSLKIPHIPTTRGHKALGRGTLGGLRPHPTTLAQVVYHSFLNSGPPRDEPDPKGSMYVMPTLGPNVYR